MGHHGIGDTSFKSDDKAVGGEMLFLTDSSMTRAFPLHWKSKTIPRVCSSSKDAEKTEYGHHNGGCHICVRIFKA